MTDLDVIVLIVALAFAMGYIARWLEKHYWHD